MKRIVATMTALLFGAHAAAGTLHVAWIDAQGDLHAVALDAQGRPQGGFDADRPVALGSLWKLVAYAQWVESGVPEKPLMCGGRDREEVYCCAPGETVDRGNALARSCGLYFSRDRVPWSHPAGIAIRRLPGSIARAVRNGTLGPATEVAPREWLAWLAAWPPGLREQVQLDLLGYWVAGAGRRALDKVAGQLRVKTWTIEKSDGTRMAGASGWNAQDLPLWFAAAGTSADVVPQQALAVLALTGSDPQRTNDPLGGRACVRVRFFARYPIQQIEPVGGASRVAGAGALHGRYRVRFARGTAVDIESSGELQMRGAPATITGQLALEDYVARVIDREARPQPAQAAWALAIAARTYVLAHGMPSQGCLEIDDSSATQRVAPGSASAGARAAAQATAGLVLAGGYDSPGLYHRDRAGDGMLSWTQAEKRAADGASYLDILTVAYPRASLASAAHRGVLACEPLPLTQAWIDRERSRWARSLAGQTGYADPGAIQVCRLAGGRAHASAGAHRIDVSGCRTLEERIGVAHEFVHLAFARHPNGRDELFVETQARRLLGVTP